MWLGLGLGLGSGLGLGRTASRSILSSARYAGSSSSRPETFRHCDLGERSDDSSSARKAAMRSLRSALRSDCSFRSSESVYL